MVRIESPLLRMHLVSPALAQYRLLLVIRTTQAVAPQSLTSKFS